MPTSFKLLAISIVSALIISGCSKAYPEADKIVIQVEEQKQVHPPRPAPIKLEVGTWKACGEMVCKTVADAKKDVRNTVAVGKWMAQANNVMDFYAGPTPKSALPK